MLALPLACMLLVPSSLVPFAPPASVATVDESVIPFGPILRVNASEASTYVARGTLPLPAGVAWEPACPLGLRRDGVVYPAQWWPVAFHADDSPSVIEIAATVPGEASVDPLAPLVEYEVVTSHSPFPLVLPQIDPAITDLLLTHGGVLVRVTDSHGNRYVASLSRALDGGGSQVEVIGRAKAVYATTGPLILLDGAPDALPYLGGLWAWFTVYDQGQVVELDLRWHNAVLLPGGPMIPNVIFESIELVTPEDWNVEPRWPMPTSGEPFVEEDDEVLRKVFPLIADGPTPHILRQRGNLTWRTVLYRDGDFDLAADARERRGWGTIRGTKNTWQDPKSLAWLGTHAPVPDLSAWEPQLSQAIVDDRAALEFALENGTNYHYPTGLGALGPYHPIGGSYGGTGGGAEIFQTPGTDLLWSGLSDGLLAEEMRHRMVLDRQYGWFYFVNGIPVRAFQLLDAQGDLLIDMYNNDFNDIPNKGALGFELVDDVYADVLPRPEYELDLVGTAPWEGLDQHDAQHGVRATYPLKTLVWAANDRMARHDLIAQASVWHMQLHDGPNGRLGELAAWVDQYPHVTGEFGRGEAWMMDGIVTWYALSWPGTRGAVGQWIGVAVDTVLEMCTPLDVFYGNRTSKITEYYEFDDQYAITQWYEVGIALQALVAARQSWATDPAVVAELEDLIIGAALAIWRIGWKPGTPGPWEQQAVAWLDPTLAAFATPSEIPADGTGGSYDNIQVGGPIGLAARYATLAEKFELEQAAQALVENTDALAGLEALDLDDLKLENRSPLIGWLQLFNQ